MFKNASIRIAVAALIIVSATATAKTTSKLDTNTTTSRAVMTNIDYAAVSKCTTPASCTGGNVVANNR